MSNKDLCLLFLDDDEVRKLSLLAIFKQLMKIFNSNASSKSCEYFDMIELFDRVFQKKAASRHNKQTCIEKIWYRRIKTIDSKNREAKKQNKRKCFFQRNRKSTLQNVNVLKIAFTHTILMILIRLNLYALWAKKLST